MKKFYLATILVLHFCTEIEAKMFDSGIAVFTGYRNDGLSWKTGFEGASAFETKESWSGVQIAELGGRLETCVWERWYLRAEGDYGWIVGGSKSFDLDYAGVEGDEWLRASSRGQVYDISGATGYLARFFGGQFEVMPLLGFSYSVQHFTDRDYKDSIHLLNLFEDVNSESTYQWMGPWAGLSFAYLFKGFEFAFEYQGHLSFFRGGVQDNLFDADKEWMKKSNAFGNEFLLKLIFPEWRRWFFGLEGGYVFYYGSDGKSKIGGQEGKLERISWNSGNILVSATRKF